MKLIIGGSRDFVDHSVVLNGLKSFLVDQGLKRTDIQIVSGGARGADACGEWIANFFDIPLIKKNADWSTHGKRAGYIRNAEMADYADAALIFWDGQSKGSKDMIDLATKKGLIVKVVMVLI